MKFWGWSGSGSRSADPCIWLVDLDPAIFVIDLQDASKKLIFNTFFSAYYFLKVHLRHFWKIKSQKEPQNSRNKGFSYYFCMMIEGSGSGAGSGSGSIPLTSRSGSGRPKNMWIRWIRIRIRNTGEKATVWGKTNFSLKLSKQRLSLRHKFSCEGKSGGKTKFFNYWHQYLTNSHSEQ